jgi:hypothetical protein
MNEHSTVTLPEECPPERTDLQPVFKSGPIATNCDLIVHAWLPLLSLIGEGGRIIVQAMTPGHQLRYWMSSSATMDKLHHGQRSYHVDLLFPVRQGDSIQIFLEGIMEYSLQWPDGQS